MRKPGVTIKGHPGQLVYPGGAIENENFYQYDPRPLLQGGLDNFVLQFPALEPTAFFDLTQSPWNRVMNNMQPAEGGLQAVFIGAVTVPGGMGTFAGQQFQAPLLGVEYPDLSE